MDYNVATRSAVVLLVAFMIVAVTIGVTDPSVNTSSPVVKVIVQGVSVENAVEAVRVAAGEITAEIGIINAVVANVPQDQLISLAGAPGIIRVTPDRPVKRAGSRIDVLFSRAVGAKQVWATGNMGQDVTVAVLDSGIDPTFTSLNRAPKSRRYRLLAYYDVFSDRLFKWPHLRQSPGDPNGHGTHIASIIGNSYYERRDGDYRGLAPGANLVAVRVLDELGVGSYSDVIQGIDWVVQNKDTYNIRVLNISLYAQPVAPYWADPYNLAAMAAWHAGIVVVASAGNGGPDPMSIGVPGNTPYIITAGAFTDNHTPEDFGDDYIPPFSAAGPTLDGFAKPDVIAPGAHIISSMGKQTYLREQYAENQVTGRYFKMSGTSMSAAVVSGICALILHEHPELTPDQVKYRLTITARPQFSEYSGEAAYSIWQQGAGRVWAPDAVFADVEGEANQGMDIAADLAGEEHYEGWTIFDPDTGQFVIRDESYNSWAGSYNSWAGTYNSWAGGYAAWANGSTNWSGDFNSWIDGYDSWADPYNSWPGGYNSWAGGYNSWAGSYNSWAGGYTSWAGGYNSWAGGYHSWAGTAGDPIWAAAFANLENLPSSTSRVGINNWVAEE